MYTDHGGGQAPEWTRGNRPELTFAEIDLSGSTAPAPLTMPILYVCLALSLAEAVVIGNVSGSCVHMGHRIVHFMMLCNWRAGSCPKQKSVYTKSFRFYLFSLDQ